MTDYEPRNWPDDVLEALLPLGITEFDTLETMIPKVREAGYKIETLSEDRVSLFSDATVFFAEVIDSRRTNSGIGQYWSKSDFADALARATESCIRHNRYQDKQLEEMERPFRISVPG
jgi:hypothetical protein